MRKRIKIASFLVAVLVVLVGFIFKERTQRYEYQTRLDIIYESALAGLNENLENIRTGLKKCIYYTSASQLGEQARELSVSAQNAKNAISVLPAGEKELTSINRFLSHVGSYSSYIAAEVAEGKEFSAEQKENLQSLITAAEELFSAVNEASPNYSVDIDLSSKIEETEDMLTDYPTLIFDGPFSDHLLEGKSELLESLDEIDKDTATSIASKIIGNTDALSVTEQTGAIEGYRFVSNGTTVGITKKGGMVSFIRKYRQIGASQLSGKQCTEYAKDYLYQIFGNKNFEESYYQIQDGLCIINFAYKNGATVCYTDLVKVGVALDNGELIFYEADGYIMSHKPRTIATPSHTVDQARNKLSGDLTVIRTKQALIPSDGGYEVLCYEFLCEDKEKQKVMMYINASSLDEERLFLIEETDNGTFTK